MPLVWSAFFGIGRNRQVVLVRVVRTGAKSPEHWDPWFDGVENGSDSRGRE